MDKSNTRAVRQTPFVKRIAAQLTQAEQELLSDVPVTSADELLSLLWNFPSLAQTGRINAAKVSGLVAGESQALLSTMSAAGLSPNEPRVFAMGAATTPAEGDSYGYALGSALAAVPSATGTGCQAVSVLPAGVWPVRDQGMRGTCVAHAIVALREHLAMQAGAAQPDLSEQFLFWATKTLSGDPRPNDDGTWARFAIVALANQGVCDEALWTYNPTPIPGNVSHQGPGKPSAMALQGGLPNRHTATVYQTSSTGANAQALCHELGTGHPVAVSLPVFGDPLKPQGHNWNSPVGVLYGRVLDPPPTAVVVGGHAVIVVGFTPDSNEASGGYFVIRNSWGTQWGRNLPHPGYVGPEPGYGQVSATYMNNFLMELTRL